MKLGAFLVSLNLKDLGVSKEFFKSLGFTVLIFKRKEMYKLNIFILIICQTNFSYSQEYIGLNSAASKKIFYTYVGKDNLKATTNETDSTLNFLIRDSTVQNLDINLHFDSSGKCDREVKILSCDSCYNKFLNYTLSNKYYRWTRIDSSTYFARFPYRLILRTGLENPFSFSIQRSNLAGAEYRKTVRRAREN